MKVVITGCSGFVGSFMASHFLAKGDTVTGIGRSSIGRSSVNDEQSFFWISADTTKPGAWQKSIAEADLVVNLAGINIFHRWNRPYKEDIYNSRVLTTENVVAAISPERKTALFSTSAMGFYGNRGEEILTETCKPGDDFLAKVCMDWETAAMPGIKKSSQVVIMRFGVVLGKNGGALGKMLPAFKAFMGGPLGDGNHWFPWIHIMDLARAMDFCLLNPTINGPINLCAPGNVRQKIFAASLGKALNRPALMPTPSCMIRGIMGEMGDALLSSTRAVPERLVSAGFEFKFPTVESALKNLVDS